MTNNNKVPIVVYYDTETSILASDYRSSDNLHICIDEAGHFVMRNLNNEKECNKVKLPHYNYKILKFNPIYPNQYFIGHENSLKIYDIRNNLEIDSIEEFGNALDVFNESNKFLIVKEEGLELYNYYNLKIEKEKEWKDFGCVSHVNLNTINLNNPDIILVGNESGDLFHSSIDN